jgi:signal transduction histidine kinase
MVTRDMASTARQLDFLTLLDGLSVYLKQTREPQKALRHALRETCEFFQATHGCIAVVEAGAPSAHLLVAIPKDGNWDLSLFPYFISQREPAVRADLLIAPLRRRGGPWALLALSRPGLPYDVRDGRLLGRIAIALSEAIHGMDRERMLGVRDRIDRKIMEQIHPKDLFYQILDGLRSLTRYDHSSALLIHETSDPSLRLVAEQIAWTKAKSQRIGLTLAFPDHVRTLLESGQVYGFDRSGERWHEWAGKPVAELAELLDYNRESPGNGTDLREASILCAPLVTRDEIVGVLKVAARHPGRLGLYDAELVERFRSQAAVAIQNLHRTESLQARVLTAERKHAMAELARSVSHDVNNALGSMLPLVQQMQEDLRRGTWETAVFSEDLQQVQKSLQVCRRIFGGMLSFARGAARRGCYGQVRRAVETASAILKDGMKRRGIDLIVEMPEDLPWVACGQTDLEQVFLNLLTNAREAMPQGGRITVHVEPNHEAVTISIADTGCGIGSDQLPRVLEPFFTTKQDGNGLGLSICRSILWEIGGTLRIQSEAGKGTRVDVDVPRLTSQHIHES